MLTVATAPAGRVDTDWVNDCWEPPALLKIGRELGEGLVSADGEVGGSLVAGSGSWQGHISTIVDEDTVGTAETAVGTSRWATSLGNSSEEVTGGGLVHLDDDIVSLTNTNVEPLSPGKG